MVHESPCTMVQHPFLEQCFADAPHNAAQNLILSGLWVENLSCCDSINNSGDADLTEFLVHLYLDEDGRMGVARVLLFASLTWFGGCFCLHLILAAAANDVHKRDAPRRVSFQAN